MATQASVAPWQFCLRREGADVAITYLPAEKKDAQETVAAIEAEGRKALRLPVTCKSLSSPDAQ